MVFENPSLVTRIAIGKGLGLVVGLCAFLTLPYLQSDVSPWFRWGVLLWYPTVGAFVGVFGVFNWHPILHLPLPWWVRAPMVGAWMNLVLTFFAYETLEKILLDVFPGVLSSPFWFALEGALVGALIGYFATRFGGEGKATVHERLAPG